MAGSHPGGGAIAEGQGIATSSLIGDTWTADELRQALLTTRHDLNSLNAHFEHWHAWPADLNSGQFTSTDVTTASADLSGALVFSVGCHAGLNVPDAWDDAGRALDFSQAFARKGASWVANTGYGYGMDDAVALSEQLMSTFVEELGRSSRVAVGEALVQAKQRYINSAAAASLGLYDEKIMIEATLYGLPMFKVSVPNPGGVSAQLEGSRALSISSEVRTNQGLITRTVTITPTFSEVTTDAGHFFSVGGEVQANGGRPIQPRVSLNIAEPGGRVRGVLFLEGHYTDIENFDPVITRPVTDTALAEPAFVQEGWYPSRLAAVNRIPTATGLLERLVVVPGQYRNPGIERLWDQLTYEVYYSTDADMSRPIIWQTSAGQVPGHASFSVDATDDSGIERVLATYSLGDGRWDSLDLNYSAEGDRWWGVLALDSSKSVVSYFVQAVDSAGNVAVRNNKGLFFEPVTYQVYLPVMLRTR